MIKSKLSLSIAREFKDIIIKNMEDIIPRDNFYMLHVPEKLDVMNSVPIVKVTTVTSTPRGHASNMTSFTAERFQVQFFFADYDETDYESRIVALERELEKYGFYYSAGYDNIDPDYNNLVTITRQYNYRNQLY